jgi:hypothetical protein
MGVCGVLFSSHNLTLTDSIIQTRLIIDVYYILGLLRSLGVGDLTDVSEVCCGHYLAIAAVYRVNA